MDVTILPGITLIVGFVVLLIGMVLVHRERARGHTTRRNTSVTAITFYAIAGICFGAALVLLLLA